MHWSIYIYGGNPMLEDEPMPFEMAGDDEFDGIMADLIELQEKTGEYQRSRRTEDPR
jgi:hypothetical protein